MFVDKIIMRHAPQINPREFHIFMVSLLVPVALVVMVFCHGFAADPERRPVKEGKYSELIQDLVSPNKPPVTQNRSSGNVKFPVGYDVAAQRKINDARQQLHDNFEESLPYLIAALDDNRYCMTINWADGDGFYNDSVGATCRNIIESQLEVYRDMIMFSGPQHWHKYDYTPISREWWQTRRDRKLYELQIEAVEWAIQRFQTGDDSDPRFEREKQLSDLRALRDSITKARKPTKSQPMHRMATRDVGTIR